MTDDAITETLRHADGLFPRTITAELREAAIQCWGRIRITSEQARIALNALAAHAKGYVKLAHITEALRGAAPPPEAPEQSNHAATREADEAHAIEVEADDAITRRWVEQIDQSDVDAILEYARRTAPPFYAAMFAGEGVTRDRLRKVQGLRGALHAVARRMNVAPDQPDADGPLVQQFKTKRQARIDQLADMIEKAGGAA